MSKVFFHYADRNLSIDEKTGIKLFSERIFNNEKRSLQILDYMFCSDEYLLNIRQTHLQHDYYTDIITFELSETEQTQAEVYISLDRIADNAKLLNQSLHKETLRVIFHGALHLCGYKDKAPEEEQLMRQKEEFYINLYNNK